MIRSLRDDAPRAGALFLVAFLLGTRASVAVSPAEVIEFGGHYYYLHPAQGVTWEQAQARAAAETLLLEDGTELAGHLLTINSQAEQDFVSATFMTREWLQLHLGGYQYSDDDEPDGNWAWVTCEEVGNIHSDWSYAFLSPGEPNNRPTSCSENEDVLRMLVNDGRGTPPGTGRDAWHDFPSCSPEDPFAWWLRFVVEFDEIGDRFVRSDAPPCNVLTFVGDDSWKVSAQELVWCPDDIGNPGPPWTGVAFDDAGWGGSYECGWCGSDPFCSPTNMWKDPDVLEVFFRKSFYLGSSPLSAEIVQIGADDALQFYVNGQLVIQHLSLETSENVPIDQYLVAGDNVFAIRAWDGGSGCSPWWRGCRSVWFEATVSLPNALSCAGFEPPMNLAPVAVRGNRALAFRAQLFDAESDLVTDLDLAAPPVIQVWYEYGTPQAENVSGWALPAGRSAESIQFFFDADERWHYVLKTSNYSTPGTYTVFMESGDNREYLVDPTCIGQFVVQ